MFLLFVQNIFLNIVLLDMDCDSSKRALLEQKDVPLTRVCHT